MRQVKSVSELLAGSAQEKGLELVIDVEILFPASSHRRLRGACARY